MEFTPRQPLGADPLITAYQAFADAMPASNGAPATQPGVRWAETVDGASVDTTGQTGDQQPETYNETYPGLW